MKQINSTVKIEAACEVNGRCVIGASMVSNGVFKFNIDTGEGTYISMIPKEYINVNRLYTTAAFKDGAVYFTPFAANEIAVMDVNSNRLFKKEIRATNNYSTKKKFSGVIEFENYLFMTPCSYPAVMRINTETGDIDYFDNWVNGEKYVFRKAPEVVGSRFYVPSVTNDLLLEFDMEKCKGVLHHIGCGDGYWSACRIDDNLWLSPIHGDSIAGWNIKNHKVTKISGFPSDFEGRGFMFTKGYSNENGLFMLPAKANMGIRVDVRNMKIEKADINELSGNRVTELLTEMEGYLYILAQNDDGNRYLRLNMLDNKIDPFVFFIGDDDAKHYRSDFVKGTARCGEIVKESSPIGLNDFIEVVME